MDMKSGLRELTALSLLSALCLGLAWAHDDMFFAAIFGGGRELGEQRQGIATPWKSRCIATMQLL
jgi:hypothetical protein